MLTIDKNNFQTQTLNFKIKLRFFIHDTLLKYTYIADFMKHYFDVGHLLEKFVQFDSLMLHYTILEHYKHLPLIS